ncbi:MAG: hypothetical protein JO332_14600, partial [Planctomycetaceae bacterium]|nr:hypothetical protein [Planctomycetaceae bacterium]
MMVTIISLILAGISVAYITMSWYNQKRQAQEESATQAMYIVEAGAAQYLARMNGQKLAVPPPQGQTPFAGGSYWVPVENIVNFADSNIVGTNNQDSDFWSFQIAAKYNGLVRRATVLVSHQQSSPLNNAYHAGNRVWDPVSKTYKVADPNYNAFFGGNRAA